MCEASQVTELAVSAANITRSYGERRALDGFTLDVPRGGVFGLLGPNGSGKSTFISMLAAMERPPTGTLRVLGEAPSRALLRSVGTVFQENTADPLMRAAEYLRFAASLFGVGASEATARAAELLSRFGLSDRANDAVAGLSGGMRRRLELARALMHSPELLILDEPSTGVDAEERSHMWAALTRTGSEVTILLATNDLAEADQVCDHVAFVRLGRVVAEGTPRALKAGLRSETVRIGVRETTPDMLARIAALPGAGDVSSDGETLAVSTDDAAAFVPRIFEAAPGAVRSIQIAAASLEDAYFFHVGRRGEGILE